MVREFRQYRTQDLQRFPVPLVVVGQYLGRQQVDRRDVGVAGIALVEAAHQVQRQPVAARQMRGGGQFAYLRRILQLETGIGSECLFAQVERLEHPLFTGQFGDELARMPQRFGLLARQDQQLLVALMQVVLVPALAQVVAQQRQCFLMLSVDRQRVQPHEQRVRSLAGRQAGFRFFEADIRRQPQLVVILVNHVTHHVIHDQREIELNEAQQRHRQPGWHVGIQEAAQPLAAHRKTQQEKTQREVGRADGLDVEPDLARIERLADAVGDGDDHHRGRHQRAGDPEAGRIA